MLYVIIIVFAIMSYFVSHKLKSKFAQYQNVQVTMSGAEAAQKMLHDNGIYDVTIKATEGTLTDHYNPTDKTINLSNDVYYGHNVSAVAVAAHETGHAVQHATAYSMLELRSALVPIQNVSATIINVIFWVMFAASIFMQALIPYALLIIIAAYSILTLFAFVTLPVEVNASQRAVNWLTNAGIVGGQTRENAVDALKWAAYTYVVAALSSLATLLYYIWAYMGRSRD